MEYKVLIVVSENENPVTGGIYTETEVLRVYKQNEFDKASSDHNMIASIGCFKDVYLLSPQFQVDYEPKIGDYFTSGGVKVDNIALLNDQNKAK